MRVSYESRGAFARIASAIEGEGKSLVASGARNDKMTQRALVKKRKREREREREREKGKKRNPGRDELEVREGGRLEGPGRTFRQGPQKGASSKRCEGERERGPRSGKSRGKDDGD
jgi:hypothetical protein